MRIAIISTPRSGNTWLRYMLSDLYNAEQIAVHTPDDITWDSLYDGNIVMQLHWHRTPQFVRLLSENNFRVMVLQRHPLDVLISILQFANRAPQTVHWLNGESGDEVLIRGKSPCSREFMDYALSQRAFALLSVSNEWKDYPGAIVIKYEDLVSDTEKALYKITRELAQPPRSIAEVIDSNRIEKLRVTTDNGHFWQGKPGLWKILIPSETVGKIAAGQKSLLSQLGYDFQANDTDLNADEAENFWKLLCQ
jgi:hypothetical protein